MADDSGVWVKIVPDDFGGGGLEGLGDWAEITAVTGNPKRYTNIMVDGVEFWAFEWTANGLLTTQAGGLVDALVCGGGGAWQSSTFGYNTGTTGSVNEGIFSIGTSNNITVAAGAPGGGGAGCYGGASTLGSIVANGGVFGAPNAGVNGTSWADTTPLTSSITGSPVKYGEASTVSGAAGTGFGQPGNGHNMRGGPGVVIVRVPADKVTATGGWV